MKSRPRSPLAMVVLALLAERPMHPYRIQQLIKSRRKDDVVNVARSNSVYQVTERLLRDEMIRIHGDREFGSGPSRQTYEITAAGRESLDQWIGGMLADPVREYPEFRAAIAMIGIVQPETVTRHLQQRIRFLEDERIEAKTNVEQMSEVGLPRVLTLEDEHRLIVTSAELEWLRTVVADLEAGTLTWSTEALLALSDELEPS